MGWNPANWQIVNMLQGQESSGGLFGNNLSKFGAKTYGSAANVASRSSTPSQGSVLGANDPGSMYFDSNTGRIETPDGLRADGSAWPTTPRQPAAPDYDPYELELIDGQLGNTQEGLGRLDRDYNTGVSNLLQSYNRGKIQIGNDRTQARGQYDTTRTQNEQDYTNTRSGIRQDSGNLYNSIQRLLGGMGAGRSSAARVLAPFAVGQQAAQRFGGVQEQFGRNMGALDTSWANTDRGLTEAEEKLLEDRENKQRELETGIDRNRLDLTDRLNNLQLQRGQLTGGSVASLRSTLDANQGTIRSILDRISANAANYQNPALDVRRNTFNAPNLQNYNYSRFEAPRLQGGGYDPRADYTNPLTGVLNRDEEERR